MNLIPLILIPVLYFAIALVKPHLQKMVPFKICSICLAVSITWLALLPLFFLGELDSMPIAILMGMSLTGIMYKLEAVFVNNKLKNFWFARITLVVGGFYLIWALIEENWNLFILLAITLPISILISAFFFQGSRAPSKGIKKKLEDCC